MNCRFGETPVSKNIKESNRERHLIFMSDLHTCPTLCKHASLTHTYMDTHVQHTTHKLRIGEDDDGNGDDADDADDDRDNVPKNHCGALQKSGGPGPSFQRIHINLSELCPFLPEICTLP